MKFASLTANQRSLLAALCNAGPTRTDRLARVAKTDPQGAAHILCALRKAGLVFSKEKGNNSYAEWEATAIGHALFSDRPQGELVVLEPEEIKLLADYKAGRGVFAPAPIGHQITKFAVVTNFNHGATGTKEQALLAAEELALRTGNKTMVVGLCAEVTPPEQPRAQITLL